MAVTAATSREQNRYRSRVEAGMCCRCGRASPSDGLKDCGPCRAKAKDSGRRFRESKREACREYQKEYARRRYEDPAMRGARAARRREKVAELKSKLNAIKAANGCSCCGWRESAAALDFDHVTGKKVACLSRAASVRWSWDRIMAEVTKCDVLCANCHRVRTQERRKPRETETAYSRCMARRKRMADEIKLAAGCKDCGYKDHAEALDFDHVTGRKVKNVSRILWKAKDDIMSEIAKCEVVCARCHRLRTDRRKAAKGSNLEG